MRGLDFPLFVTKTGGPKHALETVEGRAAYFKEKAGPEIERLKKFLDDKYFFGVLLGKKNSGKGTYSKLFGEIVGSDKVRHISVGDIVRAAHEHLPAIRARYRGVVPFDEALAAFEGRSTSGLLPTEFILAAVEHEVDCVGRKSLFVDGFPRKFDQVSYSLYFRSLMGYRDDRDFFVFIDLPESVIEERMKYRVICPKCNAPRNIRLMRTKEVGYDVEKKGFYLMCDNPNCDGARMSAKEGDDLGIEAIRERLEADEELIKHLMKLEGVPKIFLRNSIPVAQAAETVDTYEITPGYRYELENPKAENLKPKVRVIEEPWVVKDDNGVDSYSLLPPAVVVSLIKQLAGVLA